MIRSPRALALLAGALAGLAGGGEAVAAARAAGGVRLVQSVETSAQSVVGHVQGIRRIDRQAYTAELRVESSLAGSAKSRDRLQIAWVERASTRDPRFAEGDRVLVSLERLPPQSIWRERFPDPEERTRVLHVAEGGDAFLRNPTLGGIELLRHYAALSPEERAGPVGVATLVQLSTGAQIPLALSAIERLGSHAALDEKLDPPSARRLVVALLRHDATEEFQNAIVELIGRHRLERVRPALEARAAGEGLAPAAVYVALGRLDGDLSPERTDALLEQSSKEYRLAAARFASGSDAPQRLQRMLKRDPEPEVRSAAVSRLVVLRGEKAAGAAAAALADSDARVRHAAAEAIGSLGAPAVPVLRDVVESGPGPAAQAAVAGMIYTDSQEAADALAEISRTHPDEAIRTLARIALGQPIGHED